MTYKETTYTSVPHISSLLFNANVEKQFVGLDRWSRTIDDFVKTSSNVAINTTYPPYNLKKIDENNYLIEMAVAGFTKEDIDITVEKNTLTIKTVEKIKKENSTKQDIYLHKGISSRSFSKIFTLAEHVEVKNVQLNNGMLVVNLEYVLPESKKPRKIEIT